MQYTESGSLFDTKDYNKNYHLSLVECAKYNIGGYKFVYEFSDIDSMVYITKELFLFRVYHMFNRCGIDVYLMDNEIIENTLSRDELVNRGLRIADIWTDYTTDYEINEYKELIEIRNTVADFKWFIDNAAIKRKVKEILDDSFHYANLNVMKQREELLSFKDKRIRTFEDYYKKEN